MEPIWGLILFLFCDLIVAGIASRRGFSGFLFFLGCLAGGFALVVLGSFATGGNGMAMGLMGYSSLLIGLLIAVFSRNRAERLEAGEKVDGYKLCPFCAEQVREAALKCKHCGSELQPT
ncbi:hypothetical protein [Dyella sp. EPa41]|uniref:hypothetical protein n=1 Tax=Dyella sp. EPa41 TaxID=1561194 RepID=UPI00191695B2|nr:hypothetical protein [Dyella sp. EPa41]